METLLFHSDGIPVYVTEHALRRYAERIGDARISKIAHEIGEARPTHAVRDGLHVITSKTVAFFVAVEGLVGCDPVRATIVTVVKRDDVQDRINRISGMRAGATSGRWRKADKITWPPRSSSPPAVTPG